MSESSIRALPMWQHEVHIEPLSGGLTNENFLVVDGDRAFAVREGKDDPALGIDRTNELACTRAAADLGIAPRVAHSAPGLLVSEFVADSEPLTPESLAQPAMIERVVRTIRAIHDAGPGVTEGLMSFSPFDVTRDYVHFASDEDLALPCPADKVLGEIQLLQSAVDPSPETFCHNDMMPGNFLDTGDRLWVIDWEYSGVGPYPLFDLAGLSSNCGYTDAQDTQLLEAYSDADRRFELGRAFHIMKAVAALRESLWAVVQGSRTRIDFDYDGYRDDNFAKYVAYCEVAMPGSSG
jgi:thiamine kinase-like enzyme